MFNLGLNKSWVSQYLICWVLFHDFRALLAWLVSFLQALCPLGSLLTGQVLLRRQLWLAKRVVKRVFWSHSLDYDPRVRHLHCNVVAQAVSLIVKCERSRQNIFIISYPVIIETFERVKKLTLRLCKIICSGEPGDPAAANVTVELADSVSGRLWLDPVWSKYVPGVPVGCRWKDWKREEKKMSRDKHL